MPEDKKQFADYPFAVGLVGIPISEGGISGHEDRESAQQRCDDANQKAAFLGVKARYAVRS